MPTKCCRVIHDRLTSERKASTSPPSFINHSTLLPRSSARAPSSLSCHALRALDSCRLKTRRRVGSARRAVEVIICMITRDLSVISMTSQASLSLSLYYSQKSLTHNIGSASALPIITLLKGAFNTNKTLLKGENYTPLYQVPREGSHLLALL